MEITYQMLAVAQIGIEVDANWSSEVRIRSWIMALIVGCYISFTDWQPSPTQLVKADTMKPLARYGKSRKLGRMFHLSMGVAECLLSLQSLVAVKVVT